MDNRFYIFNTIPSIQTSYYNSPDAEFENLDQLSKIVKNRGSGKVINGFIYSTRSLSLMDRSKCVKRAPLFMLAGPTYYRRLSQGYKYRSTRTITELKNMEGKGKGSIDTYISSSSVKQVRTLGGYHRFFRPLSEYGGE